MPAQTPFSVARNRHNAPRVDEERAYASGIWRAVRGRARGTPSMGNEGARVARELDLGMGPKGYKNRCSMLKSAAGLIFKRHSCSTTSGRGLPINHCNFSVRRLAAVRSPLSGRASSRCCRGFWSPR